MRRWWSVVAGTLTVVAVRVVLSTQARYPRVVADEAAYLAMARVMAGGERWNLGLASTYGPAYSVLLAPWFALGLSPDAIYRAAILTNVALAGLTFLAFEALARRLPGVTRPLSSGLALVAASLPALVATTNLAWSDDLAPLAFAVLVLALLEVVARPRPLAAGLLAATAVLGYAVHGRFLPLAPVVLAVLAVLALARRLRWPVAIAAGAGLVLGLGLVQLGQGALYDHLYDPGQVTQGLNEAERITRIGPLIMSTTGQLWYLLVTTAGVAGIGGLALLATGGGQLRTTWTASRGENRVRQALSGLTDPATGDGAPAPLATLACLALVALGFVTSVVFMTDRPRGDHLVYGRYNDLFVGPLVLAGLSVLAVRRRRSRATVLGALALVATVAAAAVLWRYRQGLLSGGYLVYPVLGLVAIHHAGPQELPAITAWALGLGAVLLVISLALPGRARAIGLVLIATLLCVAGAERAVDRIDPSRQRDPRDFVIVADVLDEPGDRLAWVAGEPDFPIAPGFYRDQLYTPEVPSVRLAGTPWESGEPFLITGATHPGPAGAGYRLAWVDPGSPLGLWVAPGPRQDALAADDALLPPGGLVPPPGGDEGTVSIVGQPTIAISEDSHITVDATVRNTSSIPWATVAPGGPGRGRVRVGVTVHATGCVPGHDDCTVIDGRADIERWVEVGSGEIAVAARLDLPPDVAISPYPGDNEVTVQLLREGDSRFGASDAAVVR